MTSIWPSIKKGRECRNLTNRMWFSVVYTLIENDIRHHSGQNVVMKNIVGKSTDNAEPYSICFLF